MLEARMVLNASSVNAAQFDVDPREHDSSSILVRFRPGAAAGNGLSILAGTQLGPEFKSVPGLRIVELGAGNSVEAALHAYGSNPNVLYAEPNYRLHALLAPNDPGYPDLYGLNNTGQTGGTPDADIDAPEAWDIATGDGTIVVGVIDTGVDYTHPDLAANMWTNPGEIPNNNVDDDANGIVDDYYGANFIYRDGLGNPTGDSIDDFFHGTHVAGTIGAVGDNDTGVVGVNWHVKIMSLKFLGSDGFGSTADAVAAVDYATAMRNLWVSSGGTEGANVRLTSNSWGGGGYDQALLDAINAGGDAGIMFVAAAGNSGLDADADPQYPAAYDSDNIISVAATDANDNKAGFSNWGLTSVDLGAPGVDIYSTFPTYLTQAMSDNGFSTDYGTISGTSMATPHVSGVAALAWSLNPSATVAEIRSAILDNVDPINALKTNGPTPVATGGRLNAFKTLQAVGMAVGSSTPAAGEIVTSQPTNFVVNFSHPYDASTVQASDLTVNGIPADSLTTPSDSDTVTFHFDATPVTAQGLQTMHIAAGAVSAAPGSGLPNPLLHEWTATFRYDAVRMQVDSTVPGDSSAVTLPLSTLKVVLNEAVDGGSVQPSDLTLSQGTASTAILDPGDPNGKTIVFGLSGVTSEGTLSASIAAGALADGFGNPNLAFAGSYSLDIGTVPYPTPLVPVAPLGSLIHDPAATGFIQPASDTDSFTIDVEAGQRITVVVDPSAGLQPTITLAGPGVSAGPVSAPGIGKDAVIETAGPTTGGTYTVTVGSAAGTGQYNVQVILNAAVELESHDGPPATVQNIDGSFLPLLKGATRGAVLGQTDDSNPTVTVFSSDFQNGDPGDPNTGSLDGWTINNGASGLWHLSTGHRAEFGHSANHSLYFGAGEKYAQKGKGATSFTKGTYEVKAKGKVQVVSGNIASPTIVLPTGGQITVDFNYLLQTQGSTTVDLAQLQIKGTSGVWTTLTAYNGVAESSVWRTANPVDISAYSGQTVQLRFNFDANNQQNNFEGWYVDDVRIRQTVPHDVYSFTVGSSQRVTVALETQAAPGSVNVVLQNASGTTLASSAMGPLNVDSIIYNHGPLAAGTYKLAVSGQPNTDYSLVVTLGAVFDSEPNNTFATAQNMDGVVGALGYLGGEGRVGYFTDGIEFSTGPAAAIAQAGFTPVQITNISSFDLSGINILMVDESDNSGLSSALSSRLAAIQTWVQGGGVFMVHDRFVSNDADDPQPNPFLLGYSSGPTAIQVNRDFADDADLDVIPPGATLVTSGPHGTITNSTLDGGTSSNHGFAVGTTLPAGATKILSAGFNTDHVAAFSYDLGSGSVYYSTIPLDFYLDGNGPNPPQQNLATIYTPNMLVYGDSLNPAPASDWYSVTLTAGAIVYTITPGDGVGEPGNNLNPHIELYNSSGVLVTSGLVLPDGRNETITVPAGGAYRIRVTAEGGTSGEYFLDPIQIVAPSALATALPAAKSISATVNIRPTATRNAPAYLTNTVKLAAIDIASTDLFFASLAETKAKSSFDSPRPKSAVPSGPFDLTSSAVTAKKRHGILKRGL